jgi:4a-hydroxytetrahydrobiopterin dehydratase
MSELADRQCVPCRGGVPPLTGKQISPLLAQLDGWDAIEQHHLEKSYRFKNYSEALAFVNRLSEVAENEGHHPDICFGWGQVQVKIWTHKIDGLTESDFILAAKVDQVL